MKLIIVRHGETLWNRHNRLQGQMDVPISRIGLSQAKMLAERLRNKKIDVIYTSRLQRAVKTAEEIKKFHRNAMIVKDKMLNEMSWGIWEGLKIGYIKKKYRNIYGQRKKNKFNFQVPKGESPKQLNERVKKAIKKIIRQNKDKNILIVGHGGVNRAILGILLKWGSSRIISTRLNNASISILNIKNNKARMSLFNNYHHLKNGSLPC